MKTALTHPRTLTLLAVIAAAAALRLLPLPHNFAPVGALALFGGAMFTRHGLAFGAPLAAMFISDLLLGRLVYGSDTFAMALWVYPAFVLIAALGRLLHERVKPTNVAGATLAGTAIFFLVTNFGSWLMMYPLTPSGLLSAYIAAIPFVLNTLLSDVFFAAVLFGGFALAQQHVHALRPARAAA